MKMYVGGLFLISTFALYSMESGVLELKYGSELAQQVSSSNNSRVHFQFNINTSLPFGIKNTAVSFLKIPNGLLPSDRMYQHISQLHSSGDLDSLQKEYARVKDIIRRGQLFPMRYENAQLRTIRYFLDQPAMKLLETIQKGSLAQAQQALRKMYFERILDAEQYTNTIISEAHKLMKNRPDYRQGIVELIIMESQSTSFGLKEVSNLSTRKDTTDMVTTTVQSVVNIHSEIDKRIEEALNAIKSEDKDFDQHTKVVENVLNHLKEQGLLNPQDDFILTPEMCDAIVHGIKHFIKEFKPENPLHNPQKFLSNVMKYSVYASFNCVTGGCFFATEKMTIMGMQLHTLLQKDFSKMSLEQRAEYIAEQTAEIAKGVLADQVGRRALPHVKLPGWPSSSFTPHEVVEIVTPEGVTMEVLPEDTSVLQRQSHVPVSREEVLPRVKTYEQARNKAFEIIGKVDEHTGQPHYGRIGVGKGKIVGRRWHGNKVIMRLDYDPIKGPHINITDFRYGKGSNSIDIAIPFDGTLETVQNLLKHLNK